MYTILINIKIQKTEEKQNSCNKISRDESETVLNAF